LRRDDSRFSRELESRGKQIVTEEPTKPDQPSPQASPSHITTHPLIGIAAVLLGASVATFQGRLISVGLSDLRSAMHLGVDEASWIGTAFNAAMMFIGPFSVYLGGLLGPRRVLLACGVMFSLVSVLLAFTTTLPPMLFLLALAGLTAGTFYPLTLSFVLRNLPMRYVLFGIAAYAMDIVFTTYVATSLEAWYVDHLSWHWIFWNSALLTPIMVVLIYYGIPWQPLPKPSPGHPRPDWRGFLYGSLGFSLFFIALDQGQRLDWWHSSTIVALTITGAFLLLCTVWRRLIEPNPLVHLGFLFRRNTLLLAVVLVFFRFVMLGPVLVLPSYLGNIQGYRALQTGPVLLWVAIPQCVCGLLAIYSLRFVDARAVLTAGFGLVAVASVLNMHVDSMWYGGSFWISQSVMAIGLALAFNGLVGGIILEVVNTGALTRPIDVLTFAGFFQTVRLFGGEAGTAFMQHFLSYREQFHSNILGLGVQLGQTATDQRLLGLKAGMAAQASGPDVASGRALEILTLQVRGQAFTLSIADGFALVAWAAVACLVVVACMGMVQTKYRQVTATPAVQPA
jgi:MFS transporter, DHA2 family, multidrug resistance protein